MARSGELPICYRNHKGWSKAITVRSNKIAIGWIFKQFLCCTVLGPTVGKLEILPLRSSVQVHTQDVAPQCPWIFQTDLGSVASPIWKTWWNRYLDVGLPFPVIFSDFLTVTPSREILLKNDLQSSIFKQLVALSTQNVGKAIFLWGRKGNNRECVFRHLSVRNCLDYKTWDLQACP